MAEIKLPIEWHNLAEDFLDADGCIVTVDRIVTAINAPRREDALVERLAEAEKVIDALYDKSSVVYLDDDGVDRTRGNKLAIMYRLARNYKALAADDKAKGEE